jgi:hypothetical protein
MRYELNGMIVPHVYNNNVITFFLILRIVIRRQKIEEKSGIVDLNNIFSIN